MLKNKQQKIIKYENTNAWPEDSKTITACFLISKI